MGRPGGGPHMVSCAHQRIGDSFYGLLVLQRRVPNIFMGSADFHVHIEWNAPPYGLDLTKLTLFLCWISASGTL